MAYAKKAGSSVDDKFVSIQLIAPASGARATAWASGFKYALVSIQLIAPASGATYDGCHAHVVCEIAFPFN